MSSDAPNVEQKSVSRTPKFSTENAKNVGTNKTIGEPVKPLDLDLINEVNADIHSAEGLLETNLKIKRENDANRKALRNTLTELHEKRRRIILGGI